MDTSIGAFEAKAQLSRLLRAVEEGERFTITVRGKPVADLVPHRAQRQVVAALAPSEPSIASMVFRADAISAASARWLAQG